MKKKIYLAFIFIVLLMLVACGKKEGTSATESQEELDEFMTDDRFDPSLAEFIAYARILGQGHELHYGSEKREMTNDTTVFIGDSFFDRRKFWTDFYTTYYSGKDVFLAGIGSTKTQHWELLLDTIFYSFKDTQPKNVVVHLGTNDLWSSETTAYDVTMRLQRIFSTLNYKFPNTKIYYCGITSRADGSAQDRIDKINQLMMEWCSKNSSFMTYVDTPSRIGADALQSDGLHPLPDSYGIFTTALEEAGCEIVEKVK